MKLSCKQAREMGLVAPQSKRAARDKKAEQAAFKSLCKAWGLPEPACEVRFHPKRRWRFDYLFGTVAVEQVGGTWIGGHHSRGKTQQDDMARRNEAQLLGFIVLEFTPQQIEDGSAMAVIKRALEAKPMLRG